jgi:GTP cyclohydrolase I
MHDWDVGTGDGKSATFAGGAEGPPVSAIEQSYRRLLTAIAADLEHPDLKRTPARAARAFAFMTSGYGQTVRSVVQEGVFKQDERGLVRVHGVEFFSLCEHHLLPFFGSCDVTYAPNGKILGLSKIARIVDLYAHRLQVQERLTSQIARALEEVVEPRGVLVKIEARHLCMAMRGVRKLGSTTVTTVGLGSLVNAYDGGGASP